MSLPEKGQKMREELVDKRNQRNRRGIWKQRTKEYDLAPVRIGYMWYTPKSEKRYLWYEPREDSDQSVYPII